MISNPLGPLIRASEPVSHPSGSSNAPGGFAQSQAIRRSRKHSVRHCVRSVSQEKWFAPSSMSNIQHRRSTCLVFRTVPPNQGIQCYLSRTRDARFHISHSMLGVRRSALGVGLQLSSLPDERRTPNVQHRTSNKKCDPNGIRTRVIHFVILRESCRSLHCSAR